ncbi:sugar O-acetyltransferase [Candidatus Soleaferrea massiliensis]|uniref:sugar O-acetyltransferase n=1 Tax=Candidatus Soleaferrea massiliensis TaxID=1470354 RepID=UPI000590B081|nr:sugar O-acetyltransferase [Candidatus Soleaferrea massiliensis]
MTQKEKMIGGKLYLAYDEELIRERLHAQSLCFELNQLPPKELAQRSELFRKLFGSIGEDFYMETPFRCDYGYNITIGKRFYCNYNCVMLDCAPITIGDYVMIGPNVSLFAAGHPVCHDLRYQELEYAFPIAIGDHVWIGGGVIINPGVTIGSRTVIGAGSIVTKDLPDDCVCAGNPCRVIRKITDRDRKYYFKDKAVSND